MTPPDPHSVPPNSIGWRWVRNLTLAAIATLGCVFFVIWMILFNREQIRIQRTAQCIGNSTYIINLILKYHERHGHFPPAYVSDNNGKPMHSWRILILDEVDPVYNAYNFSEPWDGPTNRKLADQMPSFYACPNDPIIHDAPTALTSFVAVTGLGTAFPGAEPTKLGDIRDGRHQTILIVETNESGINWMEPRDIDVANIAYPPGANPKPTLSSKDLRGPMLIFADGRRRRATRPIPRETLKGMSTISGGEKIEVETIGLMP